MAAAFQDAGFPAAAVHGKLPQAEREHLLQQFKAGKIQASH
jgi:superfamily II DNA/RNA helicase